ncbi:hypothetical protein HDU88_008371 [Geranomyces variabilis]|nr:hypothetical protein HDU88_008371 [Geranomyces variabilis]
MYVLGTVSEKQVWKGFLERPSARAGDGLAGDAGPNKLDQNRAATGFLVIIRRILRHVECQGRVNITGEEHDVVNVIGSDVAQHAIAGRGITIPANKKEKPKTAVDEELHDGAATDNGLSHHPDLSALPPAPQPEQAVSDEDATEASRQLLVAAHAALTAAAAASESASKVRRTIDVLESQDGADAGGASSSSRTRGGPASTAPPSSPGAMDAARQLAEVRAQAEATLRAQAHLAHAHTHAQLQAHAQAEAQAQHLQQQAQHHQLSAHEQLQLQQLQQQQHAASLITTSLVLQQHQQQTAEQQAQQNQQQQVQQEQQIPLLATIPNTEYRPHTLWRYYGPAYVPFTQLMPTAKVAKQLICVQCKTKTTTLCKDCKRGACVGKCHETHINTQWTAAAAAAQPPHPQQPPQQPQVHQQQGQQSAAPAAVDWSAAIAAVEQHAHHQPQHQHQTQVFHHPHHPQSQLPLPIGQHEAATEEQQQQQQQLGPEQVKQAAA